MHSWVQGVQGTVQPKFRPIVDPDAPALYRRFRRRLPANSPGGELAGIGIFVVCVLLVPLAMLGPLGYVAIAALVGTIAALAVADLRLGHRHVVLGSLPRHQGRPITGEGLERLADISERFAFARRKIDELPELIRWEEIEILRGYQRTADRLMNHAADAVAAATVAADLGYDLEVALESPAAAEANVRLEAAIQRLDALAEAWRALDASTDLRAAALAVEQDQRAEEARANARRLMARLGDTGDESPTSADGGGSMG